MRIYLGRLFAVFMALFSLPLFGGDASHPRFAMPKPQYFERYEILPVSFLEQLKVDSEEVLSPAHLKQLEELFIECARLSRMKYNQTFPMDASSPAYLRLKTVYPSLARREGLKGSYIMLDDIAEVIGASRQHETNGNAEVPQRRR